MKTNCTVHYACCPKLLLGSFWRMPIADHSALMPSQHLQLCHIHNPRGHQQLKTWQGQYYRNCCTFIRIFCFPKSNQLWILVIFITCDSTANAWPCLSKSSFPRFSKQTAVSWETVTQIPTMFLLPNFILFNGTVPCCRLVFNLLVLKHPLLN